MIPQVHRGKLAGELRITAVRELTREDLAELKTNQRVQPRVKAFRETHHRLARLIASGMRLEEIMRITGYSYVRICTLKGDPAFADLIASYHGKVIESWANSVDEVNELAADLILRSLRMEEEHIERAEESGELIPLRNLATLRGDLMDRFGYSKKTMNTNVVIDFGRQLEAAMSRRGQSTVIDAKANVPEAPALTSTPQEEPSTPPNPPEAPKSAAAKAGIRRRM